MHWHPWNEATFARAQERGTPVFLVLSAAWCRFSAQFQAGPLQDERVKTLLSESFVCVQVDKDEHPEVDREFRGGGWPSLVWLSGDRRVLHRAGALSADALLKTARALIQGADEDPAGKDTAQPDDGLSLAIVDDVQAMLLAASDPEYGGWGKRQKFPHPEALHFAMVRWSQTGDAPTLELVTRTLRHMQASPIYDSVEGGFFRYARRADWSEPHHQKMLGSNAQRLMAYVEAYQVLGDAAFAKTAEGIVDWMQDTLLDAETGAFRASQDEDPEYFHLSSRKARAARKAPECDPRIVTERNAHVVCALLKGGLVLERESWTQTAVTTLDFLCDELIDKRSGVHNYWDGAPNLSGLLLDQATLLRAMVEAVHYAGENRFLAPALALAEYTLAEHSSPTGSLFERLQDRTPQGAPGERNETLPANAIFASALMRLGHLLGREDLRERSRQILAAFAPSYRRYGHFIADYGRAVDLLYHPPVHVIVVGDREHDLTRALRQAALRPYVASRVVQSVDPGREPELLEQLGLAGIAPSNTPTAYMAQGRESYASTTDPARLPSLMTRTERG
ncbi:MAG: hypothetical protein ACI9HE_001104 [Planctomycetota bacterium]|jgi:uncharacterized protein YyaL (SSP411 family)